MIIKFIPKKKTNWNGNFNSNSKNTLATYELLFSNWNEGNKSTNRKDKLWKIKERKILNLALLVDKL